MNPHDPIFEMAYSLYLHALEKEVLTTFNSEMEAFEKGRETEM